MDESMRQEIALFRYGLIAPLVNGQVDPKSYVKEVSTRMHAVPHYGEKRIAAKTILDWCTQYKKGGFEALKPKRRADRGHSRRLTMEDEEHILALRKKYPHAPVTVFYQHLIEQGEIEK
ncbi:MAG: IS481 family transposase, partial [Anoxybacillus sp.]